MTKPALRHPVRVLIVLLVTTLSIGLVGLAIRFQPEIRWTWRYLRSAPLPHSPLPSPPPACDGCSLILIALDTLRADTLIHMPRLRAIAAESMLFTHAYTPAFYTTPSHMSVFTSLYPDQHRVMGAGIKIPRNPRTPYKAYRLSAKIKTLAEILRDRGYRTAWYGPMRLKHLDFELGFARGFEHIRPSPFTRPLWNGEIAPRFQADHIPPPQAREFLFIHSYITHLPYVLPDAKEGPFARDELWARLQERRRQAHERDADSDSILHALGQDQLRQFSKMPGHSAQEPLRRAYVHSVSVLDSQIGELWAKLKDQGRLQNTVVAFFADHGEELLEHGQGSHSSFYEHTSHVPLIIYHPRLRRGLTYDNLISLIDLMPTLLALLGVPVPPQARGLNVFTRSRAYVFGSTLGNEFISDGAWKLLRTHAGRERLFYLPLDPLEKHNLRPYQTLWTRDALARLRREQRRWELEQAL
ncbi:MAG: sulfatase [Bdellovibrionales bacterium]